MSAAALLVVCLVLALATLYAWAFRHLPGARWQVLAAVPVRETPGGRFRAANLTWYGAFNALACALAAMVFALLLGSVGATGGAIAGLGLTILGLGFAASRLLARWIEGKKHTSSVGAAVFATLLTAPLVAAALGPAAINAGPLLPTAGDPEPAAGGANVLVVLAALAVAYVLGESVGRLACISFGCCYGKRVAELGPAARRAFGALPFVFRGATKKIAYASGLEGVAVVPIQALSAVALGILGLTSMSFFLAGLPRVAFLLAVAGSQLWRVYSETLRCDHRGGGRITAYQAMAIACVPASWLLAALLPAPGPLAPRVEAGLAVLWRPEAIVLLEVLAAAVFAYTGWSKVTGSWLSLRVYKSRI